MREVGGTRLRLLLALGRNCSSLSILADPGPERSHESGYFWTSSPGKGFPGSSAGKESTCIAEDPSSIPGSGRFPWRRDSLPTAVFMGFPGDSAGKESAWNAGDLGLIPGLGRFPWRRPWQPTPVFLPGKIPWTEEHGGLQSMGSQRVGHD